MTTLDSNTAKKLEGLVQQRKSHQISQWTFEQSKRELLGEPLEGQPHYVRDAIIAVVIGIAVLSGLAIAYPTKAEIFINVAWNMIKIDTRSYPEQYQDYKQGWDDAADSLFGPVDPLRER